MAYIGNTASTRYVANRAASVYSGDDSTVAFTLEEAVGSDEDILVSVDGVIQEPSVAYVVSSGTTLTFDDPPSSNAGNNIFVYYLSLAKGSIVHPSNQNLSAGTGTFTGNLIIPNAGNIGSVGDTDAMSIASNGVVTFTQTPVNARLASPFPTGTNVTSEGGAATTNISQGLAKGWCHLTGTGTPASADALNIGTVTDTDTGRYTLNFSTNFGNANYVCVSGMAGNDAVTVTGRIQNVDLTPTTSAFAFRNIKIGANSGAEQAPHDDTNILLALLGDLA